MDRFQDVHDPQLSITSVSLPKKHLLALKLEETNTLNSLRTSFLGVSWEQIHRFPEIVHWCALNYFSSERLILDMS